MRGFIRSNPQFGLCGLNCLLCPMQLGGHCPGCGGGAGNQSCAIARCSIERGGLTFCWECPSYPCGQYAEFDLADSFLPHSRRQQDVALAQAMGIPAYLGLLGQKRAILDTLLANYNDGRRKSLFCAAVYLLPLEELQVILSSLAARGDLAAAPAKEKAHAAATLLQAAADRSGVCLKLNKKK